MALKKNGETIIRELANCPKTLNPTWHFRREKGIARPVSAYILCQTVTWPAWTSLSRLAPSRGAIWAGSSPPTGTASAFEFPCSASVRGTLANASRRLRQMATGAV